MNSGNLLGAGAGAGARCRSFKHSQQTNAAWPEANMRFGGCWKCCVVPAAQARMCDATALHIAILRSRAFYESLTR